MKILAATLVVLAATAVATPAEAGFRCSESLIQEGDSAARVLMECGEPLLRQTIALEDTSKTEGVVEQWTYDRGTGAFLVVVTFEAGKVSLIEQGKRP